MQWCSAHPGLHVLRDSCVRFLCGACSSLLALAAQALGVQLATYCRVTLACLTKLAGSYSAGFL
jgi:hypothetical protein